MVVMCGRPDAPRHEMFILFHVRNHIKHLLHRKPASTSNVYWGGATRQDNSAWKAGLGSIPFFQCNLFQIPIQFLSIQFFFQLQFNFFKFKLFSIPYIIIQFQFLLQATQQKLTMKLYDYCAYIYSMLCIDVFYIII